MSTNQPLFVKGILRKVLQHEVKVVLTLNKPIYVGFTVLELSKWLMYGFHYNYIKKKLMLIIVY